MEENKKKSKKIWVFIAFIIVVLILNHIFGWSDYLGDVDNLEFLKQMVIEHRAQAALIYMVVTIVGCVVLALPGVTFAILAGAVFGPFLGTVLCSLSTTIGAIIAFLVGRFFLQDTIKPMAMKNRYLKKWLFGETNKNQLFVLMLTRLLPVFPYNLQNFAYGVTDIKFSTYSIGSFVFMIPGTAMYTIGTAGIMGGENRILYIGITIVLIIVVFGLSTFLKKRYIQED